MCINLLLTDISTRYLVGVVDLIFFNRHLDKLVKPHTMMNKIPNIKCYGTNIHIQVHKHVCVCVCVCVWVCGWVGGCGWDIERICFLSLTLFKYSLYTLNLSNNQHQNFLSKFPSLKDNLFQVWLKFAQWFLRRNFSNFINQFSLFHFYLPWNKHKLE